MPQFIHRRDLDWESPPPFSPPSPPPQDRREGGGEEEPERKNHDLVGDPAILVRVDSINQLEGAKPDIHARAGRVILHDLRDRCAVFIPPTRVLGHLLALFPMVMSDAG